MNFTLSAVALGAVMALTAPAAAQDGQSGWTPYADGPRHWVGVATDLNAIGGPEWRFDVKEGTPLTAIAPTGFVRTDGTFSDTTTALVTRAQMTAEGSGYKVYGGFWLRETPWIGVEAFYAESDAMTIQARVEGAPAGLTGQVVQTLRYADDLKTWGVAAIGRSPKSPSGFRGIVRLGFYQWRFENSLRDLAVTVAAVEAPADAAYDAYRTPAGTRLTRTLSLPLTTRGDQWVGDVFYAVGVDWELPYGLTLRAEHERYMADDFAVGATRAATRVGLQARF